MTTATVPAYRYRAPDGLAFTWNRGPWIVAETSHGDLVDHIAAPDTFTVTAFIAAVDAWRMTRG